MIVRENYHNDEYCHITSHQMHIAQKKMQNTITKEFM